MIGDRAEAIRAAVSWAGPGDAIVIAGKGHETGQLVNGVTHHFDDRGGTSRRAERGALMITLTLAEVAEIVGGQLNGDPHIRVDSVEFDSRKVTPHTLFVALRGARVDGHDFATSVDGPVLAARPVDAPSVVVPHIDNPQSNADAYAHDPSGDNASVLEALSKLARYNIDHRGCHGHWCDGVRW